MKRIVSTLALLSMAAWVVACKDGDPLSFDPGPPSAGFVAEPPTVPDRFVSLEPSSVNGGRIVLDVAIHDVAEPISALVMKLTYPDSFSVFDGCDDGDLLPPGECSWGEQEGEVFLFRTITAPQQSTPAPGPNGERVIARLTFFVFRAHTGQPITIEAPNLVGGDATALLDADGDPILVDWFAGTLVGN